jgi:hypothetical protein
MKRRNRRVALHISATREATSFDLLVKTVPPPEAIEIYSAASISDLVIAPARETFPIVCSTAARSGD